MAAVQADNRVEGRLEIGKMIKTVIILSDVYGIHYRDNIFISNHFYYKII